MPEISYQFIESFFSSRINYKSQWAGHPTLKERKEKLDGLGLNVMSDETRAWGIFDNQEQLQENLTNNLYKSVEKELRTEFFNAPDFEKWFLAKKEHYSLPPVYKRYYDNRYVIVKEWNFAEVTSTAIREPCTALFTKKNSQLPAAILSNENDINVLNAIKGKQLDVKNFDFDGIKHAARDSKMIIE